MPVYVKLVFKWLRDRIEVRRTHPCMINRTAAGTIMRVDAKAEGASIAIGGWLPALAPDGSISKCRSKWFHCELTPEQAPWAYSKGRPNAVISTLELLASLVGLVALDPLGSAALNYRGSIALTGFTDSQVATNVVGKSFTSSFPLFCVSMELSAQLEQRNAVLDLEWVPRGVNTEADALADGKFTGFSQKLRVHADPKDLQWIVLDKMFQEGLAFHEATHGTKAKPASESAGRGRAVKKPKLKDIDPW